MAKKAALCALIFIVLLAAALLADSALHTRYQPQNPGIMQHSGIYPRPDQTGEFRNVSSGFSPREYIKILRGAPESPPNEP